MLSEPENYGLNSEQTLAHRCVTRRPDDFAAYWSAVREEVAGLPGVAKNLAHEGPFRFQSVHEVIIEGCMIPPSGDDPPVGGVLELHGSDVGPSIDTEPPPWAEIGLLTMRIHARGFPPSVENVGDQHAMWLCCQAGSPQAWIVRHAVADVMQAYRVFRRSVGDDLPVSLIGPSLGGGLAVMATAQLAAMGDQPSRLVLDLPSLGDWAWRSERYCNGLGGQLNQLIDSLRGADREQFIASLAYCDAALHAPEVTCPVLCRLAEMDDVAPAPSAAAICNALGSRAVERVVTRYGHFDGGLSHAREVLQFRQLIPRFLSIL